MCFGVIKDMLWVRLRNLQSSKGDKGIGEMENQLDGRREVELNDVM